MSSGGPLIDVKAAGKAFPAVGTPSARARACFKLLAGFDVATVPVLRNVSFEVRPGESLGIIGSNGAGKSTLLKLVTGVWAPSSGSVTRRGRIGALLELGAGFDPERTGRDNIRTNAALLGMTASEFAAKREAIIAFADIGRYIDEPVKHYSSGMVVRLGFAVVAAARPELLVTDEVLAVGDESFQKKCVRFIEDYLDDGGTLLLVSHSMYHVQKLCRHALWLKEGQVEAYGDVFDVTQDYLAWHERKGLTEQGPDIDATYAGTDYRIVGLEIDGDGSAASRILEPGRPLKVRVTLQAPGGVVPHCGLGLVRSDGSAVYGTSTEIETVDAEFVGADRVRYDCELDLADLLPGHYMLKLHALDPEGVRLFDTVERALVVRGATRELGTVRLPIVWRKAAEADPV